MVLATQALALPVGANGSDVQVFQASLSGANEVPPVDTPASGEAVLALSADMSTLYYRVFVNDIVSITAAHIHKGGVDENGGVVFPLYTGTGAFDPNNPISGTLMLTPTQVLDLQAGNYYVNVHTNDNPPGEVRGQIGSLTPRSDFNALLSGYKEVPPVTTEAVGVGRFTLVSDTLTYQVDVGDIVSITAAHIHLGAADENGGVVFPLYTGAGVFDPDNPISGILNLDAQNMVDLLTSYYYVNVHTAANPGGEIRGQISGPQLFKADLSGDNEVPPLDTVASGQAVLALSADTSSLHYRVLVDKIISITAAHIHLGAADENGGVVFPLYGGAGAFDPDHPISGTISLTTTDVLDLLAGDYYINVHTVDNPGGEVRGQIGPYAPPNHLNAWLSGDNAVPPVNTDATGLTRFTLDSNLSVLHYNIAVNDIVSVTAAHIHRGTADENGPVVHWLYDSSGVNAPNGPLDSDNPVGSCLALDAWSLVDLLTGYYYVNVHTVGYPAGEIRGQIIAPYLVYLPVVVK
jgi:hypothetical protein